ncbi:hypothetical protein AB0C60_21025, partial [Streptomyces sp. NPDC048845]
DRRDRQVDEEDPAPARAATTPGHLPPYAPAYVPPDGSRRHWRTPLLAAAAALVVAVGGGAAVYVLLDDGSRSHRAQRPPADDNPWDDASPGPGTGADPDTGGSTPPGTPSDGAPSAGASDNPADGAGDGVIPEPYLGTWETAFGADGSDVRRFTLVQGEQGDTVFRMDADGTGYHCEFSAVLNSAGPPVELGPSAVDAGEPLSSCRPGPVTTLERTSDGRLIRVFTDGSGEPLTYTKVG